MENQKFTKTIREDWKQLRLKDSIDSEYKNLKDYYLTGERKKKLESMSAIRKFFIIPYWLLKSLFFKLTPFRRILLLFAILLILIAGNNKFTADDVSVEFVGTAFFGGLILIFILALELKDKLTAKTELEEGRAIQLALMPEQSPRVNGWDIWLYTRSANDVGGDLLDFIQLDEIRSGIAVGDVAGKGLSAALLMSKLQASIRALAYDTVSLSSLAEKLNTIFHRDSPSKIFASLVYLEINSESDSIKLINAGHYPPLIVRANQIELLQKNAPALGLVKETIFNEQSILLNENDFVIIYSDGLTEAQNESGEFFGEERLVDLLNNKEKFTSQQLGEMILANVHFFVNKTPAHDDLTLAILKKV